MKVWLVCVLVLAGLSFLPALHAEAKPLCEYRSSAHIAKHGGLLKDSADHIARGELPTCDPNPDGAKAKRDNEDREKSRHCRKHWYC